MVLFDYETKCEIGKRKDDSAHFGKKRHFIKMTSWRLKFKAALAQLGERQTEDLKAPCSIHGGGIAF